MKTALATAALATIAVALGGGVASAATPAAHRAHPSVSFAASCTSTGESFTVRAAHYPATPMRELRDPGYDYAPNPAYQNWYKVSVDDGGTQAGGSAEFGRRFELTRSLDRTATHDITVTVHNWRRNTTRTFLRTLPVCP